MEENKKVDWMELLRYPVVTLCIVIGLFLLKVLIGFDLGQVSRITKDGIEFRNEQVIDISKNFLQLTMLVDSLKNEQLTMSEKLKEQTKTGRPMGVEMGSSGQTKTQKDSTVVNKRDWSATEFASESLAKLSYVDAKNNTILNGKEGYIWLGDYNEAQATWKNLSLQIPAQRITRSDETIRIPSRTYNTAVNIILRSDPIAESSSPSENMLGVIPENTPVSVSDVEIMDGQYWVLIKVEK
ncbi:hypothetical protein LJC57_04640 [Parabacteroides sp. OttesenSCG-928-G07]|nr:hypothetical protein [Parabacteroides sp. OttesenSCG-928-G07]